MADSNGAARSTAANPIHSAIRAQTRQAGLLGALGVAWIAAFLWAGPSRLPGAWGYAPALLGLGLVWLARRQQRGARARWHGLSVESRAAATAIRALGRRGWRVALNLPSPCGDIDMAVARSAGWVPIEIKSFRAWNRREPRCVAALAQVARQQHFLHAPRGYIWLPDAQAGWWRRWFGAREGEVRVVYGPARRLRRILAKHER